MPPHQKEMLWTELKDMFTLPEGVDQELVKKCALKKMALAFATFKEKLYTNYIKKDQEPNWDDLPQVKPYWECSNNTNYQRKPKENPNRPRRMQQRSTTTTFGLAGTRRQLKNGRRWSRTLWIEASGWRLGIGWIDPSGGYLLTA